MMKGLIRTLFPCVLLCGYAVICWPASPATLPVIEGKKVVALLNGEPLTLDDLNHAVSSVEKSRGEGQQIGPREKMAILQRLINTRLVVQEGKKMGLDELPEITKMIDVFTRVALREQLMERQVKRTRAPEKEVERLYRETIREWNLESVLFEKEDDALKMVEGLKEGGDFKELSRRAVEEGKARAGDEGQYVKVKSLNPQIGGVVATMEAGSVSPVIPLKDGFVLVKVKDIRYVANTEEKERARQEVLKQSKLKALKERNQTLIKRYAAVHKDVLDSIDFEAKEPGFEHLRKDRRVLAHIKGEKPITVADLTEELRHQLYHGVDRAVESKILNSKKGSTLDEMIYKRVFRKEALRLGLDKEESYRYKVKEYENSVIFGAFVQKAVVPDIDVQEREVKDYYQAHIAEFTLPEMMRIRSLAFEKRADAEGALERIRKGTDFKWLLANAEGQVEKNRKGLLEFDGRPLTTKDLPEGVQKAVAGSRSGDARLYADEGGPFYVLAIEEVIPSRPKPYEEAREEMVKKIFDDKLKKSMEEWFTKLRAASQIRVYLKEGK